MFSGGKNEIFVQQGITCKILNCFVFVMREKSQSSNVLFAGRCDEGGWFILRKSLSPSGFAPLRSFI